MPPDTPRSADDADRTERGMAPDASGMGGRAASMGGGAGGRGNDFHSTKPAKSRAAENTAVSRIG